MKADIHPTYYQASVTCVGCGNSFTTGSTVEKIRVDICSNCHPFYTGQKRLVDTEGRVERFEKRIAKKTAERRPQPVASAAKAQPERAASTPKTADQPKTLREMLQDAANRG